MKSEEQAEPSKEDPSDPIAPHLFVSVSYPNDLPTPPARQNNIKSTRSQCQDHPDEKRRLKRISTAVRELESVSVYERVRREVQESHREDDSIVFSSHVRHSLQSRGLSIIDEHSEIYEPIEFSSFVAWLLLIFSSISNAIVPCWMTVDVRCESLTRSAWRIFITSLLLLPFVLYEQRHTRVPAEKFRALLSRENLQQHFIFSMNYSVWVLIGAMALKLTARSHTFALLRLKFFLISLRKFWRGESFYESEMGGSILVAIGAGMIMWDSYSLPVEENPLAFYLGYSPLSRLCGDVVSVLGSLAILYFEERYSMPKTPRFSNLFLYNLCLCVNLITIGYFFGGNEFSLDPARGVFGLFTRENFVSVFYVSIMLGLNLIIGNLLVDKIFSPFIRNVASCFEPVVTVSIYHLFSIELLAPGMACLGLAFMVPGMMLIVGGQNYLKKEEIKINFLIYKDEERQFYGFARHSFNLKMKAFRADGERAQDAGEQEEESEGTYSPEEEPLVKKKSD